MGVPEFYEPQEITVAQTEDQQVAILLPALLAEVMAGVFMEAKVRGITVKAEEIMRQARLRLRVVGLYALYGGLEDHSPVTPCN